MSREVFVISVPHNITAAERDVLRNNARVVLGDDVGVLVVSGGVTIQRLSVQSVSKLTDTAPQIEAAAAAPSHYITVTPEMRILGRDMLYGYSSSNESEEDFVARLYAAMWRKSL